MLRSLIAALGLSFIAGCTSSPRVPDAARSELAPTGELRAGMNLGNVLFTTTDAATGELRGVGVDLMRELASRLGVPVTFVIYASPGDVADAVDKDAWDVAILAIAQARAQTIAFSPAMTEIEATYIVHNDSALRSVAEVDASGVRIAAPEKAGYELYLTDTLRSATLIRTSARSTPKLCNHSKRRRYFASSALTTFNTSSTCPGTFTLRQTCVMRPLPSMRKVARSMPMNVRP